MRVAPAAPRAALWPTGKWGRKFRRRQSRWPVAVVARALGLLPLRQPPRPRWALPPPSLPRALKLFRRKGSWEASPASRSRLRRRAAPWVPDRPPRGLPRVWYWSMESLHCRCHSEEPRHLRPGAAARPRKSRTRRWAPLFPNSPPQGPDSRAIAAPGPMHMRWTVEPSGMERRGIPS